MFFNSIQFLFFFITVFTVFYITPHRFRWIVLLSASTYFYGTLRPLYLAFLYIPVIIVYFVSLQLEKKPEIKFRKTLFIIGIISSFIILFIVKYLDLVINTIHSILNIPNYLPLGLILPIGISFYTFKLLSYLIDVYYKRIHSEKHFGIFALYISFFPQLLAGPIDRAGNFIPQLKEKIEFDSARILSGINLFIWGFFKKTVVSNRTGLFVDQVFSAPADQTGINLLFGLYFYSFQIYCDFSGYSDMAIGISRILGYRSMENFNFPYFSKSLTQFWSRWHISLSSWLRDYIFLPTSYFFLRKIRSPRIFRIKPEAIAYTAGIILTMFLGGLWHGASWTFVVWGLLHGSYISFGHLTKKTRSKFRKFTGLKKGSLLHRIISIFITFHLVTFAWTFFRSATFNDALIYLKGIGFSQSPGREFHLLFTLMFVIVLILIEIFLYNKSKLTFLKKIPIAVKIPVYVLFIIFIIIFYVDGANEFIYFQF